MADMAAPRIIDHEDPWLVEFSGEVWRHLGNIPKPDKSAGRSVRQHEDELDKFREKYGRAHVMEATAIAGPGVSEQTAQSVADGFVGIYVRYEVYREVQAARQV